MKYLNLFLLHFFILKYFQINKHYDYFNYYKLLFHITNLLFNINLTYNGLFGLYYLYNNNYSNNIVEIHKIGQFSSLCYELNYIFSIKKINYSMIIHHLLLFMCVNNYKDNLIEQKKQNFYICLYAGSAELSSVFLSMINIINNNSDNYNLYIIKLIKISFAFTFFFIRIFIWTYYLPYFLYDINNVSEFYIYNLNYIQLLLFIIQLLQYYWGKLILKKIKNT